MDGADGELAFHHSLEEVDRSIYNLQLELEKIERLMEASIEEEAELGGDSRYYINLHKAAVGVMKDIEPDLSEDQIDELNIVNRRIEGLKAQIFERGSGTEAEYEYRSAVKHFYRDLYTSINERLAEIG